jgi:acyl-CoA reductase-like NAD-dependent aldehyde dehydrogenase
VEPKTLVSRNPFDESILGEYSRATSGEVHAAVARARQAGKRWAGVSPQERANEMERIRQVLSNNRNALAQTITREIGKPLLESLSADVGATLDGLKVLRDRIPSWAGPRAEQRTWMDRLRGVKSLTAFRDPLGVVGIIGTWNYPLSINVLQIAFALAAGNAVVWKPSERSPVTADHVARLFREAGLPEGLLEVVQGDGSTGEALCASGVDKILFTGSVQAGRRVLEVAAQGGTPTLLELSGLDAALVYPDAPLDRAARAITWGACANAGQTCAATRRVIVHRSVYDAFIEKVQAAFETLRVGDPLTPDVELGPMRADDLVVRLEELIADAIQHGARVRTGGKRTPHHQRMFQPTLLTDLSPTARMNREEFFGPLLSVSCAEDESDMIRQTNHSPFGLTASLWTKDLRHARQAARQLEVGTVWVNDLLISAGDARAPFGGMKSSGFGRVHGWEGFQELTRVQWVEISGPGGFRPHYFPYTQKKLTQLFSFLKWRHR